MPEGHVIHRMAAAYDRAFAGTVTRSTSPQGRFAEGAAGLDGLVMDSAEAVGKHFFAHFGPRIIHVHLGMAGRTSLHHGSPSGPVTERLGEKITVTDDATGTPADPAAALGGSTVRMDSADVSDVVGPGDGAESSESVDSSRPVFSGETSRPVLGAVRWRLENDRAWADLSGPAICEVVDPVGFDAILDRLGPDPLRPDADPGRAWEKVRKSKQPIALLLMDQKVFAGVGNIFRAEVLYRAGMDPMLPGVALRRKEFDALWADLVFLMRYAVEHGEIDTVRSEHMPEAMGRPPRVDPHGGEVYVYRRYDLDCYLCGTRIKTKVIGNRNLFWCPGCQPLSRRAAAVAARREAREAAKIGRLLP